MCDFAWSRAVIPACQHLSLQHMCVGLCLFAAQKGVVAVTFPRTPSCADCSQLPRFGHACLSDSFQLDTSKNNDRASSHFMRQSNSPCTLRRAVNQFLFRQFCPSNSGTLAALSTNARLCASSGAVRVVLVMMSVSTKEP